MDDLQNNTKYQDIVNTAHDLFWKFGIRRVTVEEICREAGASKMTFYRFFSNKKEIAKTVIKNIFDDGINKFRSLMAEDIPYAEKVKKQILLKFEGTREISPEIIKDIYQEDILGLKDFWEKKSEEVLKEVLDSYRDAQKKGYIRKDLNIEFIQHYSSLMFNVVSDEKVLALYNNVQDLIMELINLFFYGILPHEKESDD